MRPIFVYIPLLTLLGVGGQWIYPDKLHMDLSSTINQNCGDTPYGDRDRPKFGRMYENPWLVLLRYSEDTLHFCHGTLISKRYVLTTAICGRTVVSNTDATTQLPATEIILGEHDLTTERDCATAGNCSEPVTIRTVDRVIGHQNFSTISYQNDVALLYMNDTVQFDNTIRPICLPLIAVVDDSDVYKQTIYNTIYTNDSVPRQLWMRMVPTAECREQVKNLLLLTNGQICARISDDHSVDMTGSAGSALQVGFHGRMFQFGMLSVGFSNVVDKAPYIYMDISKYINWIHDTLQQIE